MNFREIKYGVKNLYKWFPIVWNDSDWCHYFIYAVLKFKLEKMEKAFRSKHAMSADAEERADEMKRCSVVLGRLMEDDYSAFDKHDKKWGEPSMEFEGNKLNIERANAVTEEDKAKESKEFLACCEHEDYLIKQDSEYVFDTMKKHIRKWWD